MTSAALCEIAPCLALCSLLAAFWRRQLDSGSTRLGETNGDRLLRRAGAMLAFPNVFHLFSHKLARLSGRRFAFTLVLPRAFNYFFFWHNKMVSPLAALLDVRKGGYVLCRKQATAAAIPMTGSQLALSCVTQTSDPVMGCFDLGELTENKLLSCWR